jgi:phosphoribosylglycinamide formyltransferase-1
MRIAVLVSGSGTNLAALLAAQAAGQLAPAEIALVVSNKPGVKALERADCAGVATVVVDHTLYASREAFEEAMLEHLRAVGVEAIVLAGFMRVLTARFVGAFEDRIINTHPALCPSFPGIHAPQQAIDAGVKVTGCTIHFVDSGVDTGPIIHQAAVDVRADDDAASLHDRIRRHEHRLLPLAVQQLAAGRIHIEGRIVRVCEDT